MITSLKAPTIKKLVRDGIFQPSLRDEQNRGEITDVDEVPGERLIVCLIPLVGAQCARKRQKLLEATEAELQAIERAVDRGPCASTISETVPAGDVVRACQNLAWAERAFRSINGPDL